MTFPLRLSSNGSEVPTAESTNEIGSLFERERTALSIDRFVENSENLVDVLRD